ncbi:MAG: hypothetical protein WC417_05150, partial [Candidatus Omnitrophota bacterium]
NYKYLSGILEKNSGKYGVSILKKRIGRFVPQSFPVLLPDRETRDQLYFRLNKEGYGAVSLYHTLIEEIDRSFIEEHRLSDRILNLPIHQDVTRDNLKSMADRMFRIINNHF